MALIRHIIDWGSSAHVSVIHGKTVIRAAMS